MTYEEMTNEILAEECDGWADAREVVSKNRMQQGKSRLDASLLREVARRLRGGKPKTEREIEKDVEIRLEARELHVKGKLYK